VGFFLLQALTVTVAFNQLTKEQAMKPIKLTILLNAVLVLFLVCAKSYAIGQFNSEQDGIQQAVEIYVRAVPMDIAAPERAKMLNQAAMILNDVIARYPDSLDARRKLTGVYMQQQNYTQSIKILQEAINLSPEDPKLFLGLAFMYEHSGALEQSIAMIDHALSLEPGMPVALDYKNAVQEKMERLAKMQEGVDSQNPHGSMPVKSSAINSKLHQQMLNKN
jgi:tetratricopeptide (TPR) repeat protein